jgi:hypothetical protein
MAEGEVGRGGPKGAGKDALESPLGALEGG